MNKAVLIIDMPKNCYQCRFVGNYKHKELGNMTVCNAAKLEDGNGHYMMSSYAKHDWCPLKPLPEKMNLEHVLDENGDQEIYIKGYNACIDEILGE